jgi:hypothetical protein
MRFPIFRPVASAAVASAVLLGLSLAGGSAAQADQADLELGFTTGHSPGTIYNGSLTVYARAGTTKCLTMKRKTSTGAWVTTGFHSGSVTGGDATISVCTIPDNSVNETWHIVNTSAVYGIELYGPLGITKELCSSHADCEAMV